MKKYSFTDSNGKTWERITKKQARAAYNNGLTVLFCPVNMRPFGIWGGGVEINIKHDTDIGILDKWTKENSFDRTLNSFECYNCTDNETGRYTAFYIPVVTVDRFTGEKPTAYTLGTVKQYDYSVMEG